MTDGGQPSAAPSPTAPATAAPSPRVPTRSLRLALTFGVAVVVVFVLGLLFILRNGALPPPGATPALPASPVEGVVIAVDSAGLGQVSGFTVRAADGFAYVLTLGTLENATEFSPSHLAEHMASSERVRAYYRLEAGTPIVYRLEDAPPT